MVELICGMYNRIANVKHEATKFAEFPDALFEEVRLFLIALKRKCHTNYNLKCC
jgi:hypothetical protein